MVERHLDRWDLSSLDFLFIENVGNLVCTAGYDLGETFRVVMLATTEGEDKPSKYPPLFQSGDAFLITKIDLARAVEFDSAAAYAALRDLRPDVPIFETSAKTGEGMSDWVEALIAMREASSRKASLVP
jgi:hydrogenase nickel incorporation protein HypB